MAYFVADEKLQGYYVSDGVTINIVKYHFECDDAASLPSQTAFITSKKVKISMASTAHTIDTDALYEMDSSGAWVQHSQPWQPLADYSVLTNKPQINGHTLTGNQSGDDLGLQNVLTFDSTPTQDSTNPVTSGGIRTDQQRQETEIGVVANAGAKNLLKVSVPDAKANVGNTGFTWSGNTASKNHVSFEIKDDLTVYVKSDTGYTASDVTIFYLTDGSCAYPNTILNGCPSGGSSTTYELRTATPVKSDYGSGVEITSDTATNVVIIIRSGWSGGLTFRPMIRPAAITDPTFQPYAKTNRELTVLTDEDRASLVELVDGGSKNRFDINTTPTVNHTTYSLTDGVLTVTSNGNWANYNVPAILPAGDYVFRTTISNFSKDSSAGETSVRIRIAEETSSGTPVANATITGNGNLEIPFSWTGGRLYIQFYTNFSSTMTFITTFTASENMICTTAALKISQAYQPYRPSWQKMYEMIIALQ